MGHRTACRLMAMGLVLAGLLAVSACSSGKPAAVAPTSTLPANQQVGTPAPDSLRSLAASRHIHVGAAALMSAFDNEADYQATLGAQFDMVTTENAATFRFVHPDRHRYDFSEMDRLVEFAQRNGQIVRGHTLIWNQENPDWLTNGDWTRDELIAVMRDHIHTVVGHYRGKVAEWDVVNEAVDERGRYRDNIWMRVIGSSYVAMAFRFAHEADPSATLYYNDAETQYAGDPGDAVYRLVVGLMQQSAPIGGVGFEYHHTIETPGEQAELARRMNSYGTLGLAVELTEVDVGMKLPATADRLRQQADQYAATLRTCLSVSACKAFVLWGFTDRHSWVPAYRPGNGAALPFDERLHPKPAFTALQSALRS